MHVWRAQGWFVSTSTHAENPCLMPDSRQLLESRLPSIRPRFTKSARLSFTRMRTECIPGQNRRVTDTQTWPSFLFFTFVFPRIWPHQLMAQLSIQIVFQILHAGWIPLSMKIFLSLKFFQIVRARPEICATSSDKYGIAAYSHTLAPTTTTGQHVRGGECRHNDPFRQVRFARSAQSHNPDNIPTSIIVLYPGIRETS